ncbi:uncharacterized protein FA14DRAFT_26897 [Meira miltonrushii]|uniref:Uncharacterized protein n=1 Tax=Meira miltonrushii TaxID=1280837 RepID=A0A316VPT0_9BASI|nr:uncharacterized protein FA14DRAFT_26897 [Meira miltonrushii]PWN38423.1 hypothetical protein FA14DRAFT_26897 [Meira miltonrushii]
MGTHRTDFIACCSETLAAESEKFSKNETFGWFHFQQDFDKSKVIDEIIVTVDVACYEVSQYDPTGEKPGSPINEYTQDVIDKLQWTKAKAKEDAKTLREAFANQSSSNSTSTPEKNTTGSGAQKSQGDNSEKGDNTSTEKKTAETTSQTSNDDSNEGKTNNESGEDNTANDEASLNESSTTDDSSKGANDSQQSTEDKGSS